MRSRLTWEPRFQEPTPDRNAGSNIVYDYAVRPPQPAILLALDPKLGHHVAITRRGWYISPEKHRFRWSEIQQPLPDPLPSVDPMATLDWFRGFLRLSGAKHDEVWLALIGWILRALQPMERPEFEEYPVLLLTGPADTGKTIAAKLLAQLLDPTREPIHSPSYLARRLPELAVIHHVLAFDDIGKGLRVPGLSIRPVILTTRERKPVLVPETPMITVELPVVEQPISPEVLWEKFSEQRAVILGAILTLLARTV